LTTATSSSIDKRAEASAKNSACFSRQASGRQGPMRGARHHRVDARIEDLVDRGGDAEASQMPMLPISGFAPGRQPRHRQEHAHHRREHDQGDHARLGQRPEIGQRFDQRVHLPTLLQRSRCATSLRTSVGSASAAITHHRIARVDRPESTAPSFRASAVWRVASAGCHGA
jgi:hypothetical protein